ncbi:MAG: hypothetical protein P4L46_09345 [Fimbriimonas sp.]|nr:hypothetical protein [Fimbriimonas sp.]
MRLRKTILVTIITVTAICTASAQSVPAAKLDALKALRTDVEASMNAIRSGMPIYNGRRANAMTALKEADGIVNTVIVTIEPPAPAAATTSATATKPVTNKKSEPAKPVVATKPGAPKTLTAEEKAEVERTQVSRSQKDFRRGLELIEKAIADLQEARTTMTAEQLIQLDKLLVTARKESILAIELHVKEG